MSQHDDSAGTSHVVMPERKKEHQETIFPYDRKKVPPANMVLSKVTGLYRDFSSFTEFLNHSYVPKNHPLPWDLVN